MFDLAASTFNFWPNGSAIIEIWLCLYIKLNGNIKIFIEWGNFDFFRFRCKSIPFRCDNHVICDAISIMYVWRFRKHSTIVSENMDLDRTHCCWQVGAIVFLVESNSSWSGSFQVKFYFQLLCSVSTFDCPAFWYNRNEKQLTSAIQCRCYQLLEFQLGIQKKIIKTSKLLYVIADLRKMKKTRCCDCTKTPDVVVVQKPQMLLLNGWSYKRYKCVE